MAKTKMTPKDVEKLFGQGFHCSQCVIKHIAKASGLNEEEAVKFTAGLGGGCFFGGTCGAVSAGVVALSNVYGYNKPNSAEQNAILIGKVQEFQNRFEKINGSILCKDLIGENFAKPEGMKRIMDEGLTKGCTKYVADACEILDDMLENK